MVLSQKVGPPGTMTSDIDKQVLSGGQSCKRKLFCDLVKLRILCKTTDVLLHDVLLHDVLLHDVLLHDVPY